MNKSVVMRNIFIEIKEEQKLKKLNSKESDSNNIVSPKQEVEIKTSKTYIHRNEKRNDLNLGKSQINKSLFHIISNSNIL